MRAAQTPVSTKKDRPRGTGEVKGPGIRWTFIQAVKWNNYDLDVASTALKKAGHNVGPLEIIYVLEVSCRPRQDKPLIFLNDPLVIGPGRNGLPLRSAAAKTLLELARRGNG